MISDLIFSFITIVLMAPVIVGIFIYIVTRKRSRNRLGAIHSVARATTPLFIISCYYLVIAIFEVHILGYILGFLLLILTIIIVRQWKNHGEILFLKSFGLLLRIAFLFFGLAYFVLIAIGIIRQYMAT